MASSSLRKSQSNEKSTVEYIEDLERVRSAETIETVKSNDYRPALVTFLSNDLNVSTNVPIPEFQGRHQYDTSFQWDTKEEKRLVRKLDLKVFSTICMAFFCLMLDRNNTTQALADNLLDDIGMNTNDYNLGQSIFNIVFLLSEIPMQLIAKRVGPDRWLPLQMVSWSLVASCQALLKSRRGYLICRALLGITEAGFIPEVVLYASYFYKGPEMALRMTCFWVSYYFCQIMSALLAFGILHLRGVAGLAGWRWLFAIEGALTGLVGFATFFLFAGSPTQPPLYARWRGPKSWFNAREEKILVNRVLRDDPEKGRMHNREAISLKMMLKTAADWHMVPLYIIGLTWNVPFVPMTQYLTLTIRSLGFTTYHTSLLSIPSSCLIMCQMLLWNWICKRTRQILLLGILCQLWAVPLLVVLVTWDPHNSPWAKYVVCILLVGYPHVLGILTALVSRNAGSVRTRTLASALFNMAVHGASILGINMYRHDDKPLYRRGNKVLLGFVAFNITLFICTKILYVTVNKRRDRIWNAMTDEERITYLETTSDEGNKRLDFRFDH